MSAVPLVLSATRSAAAVTPATAGHLADTLGWLAGAIGIGTGWPQAWRLWAGRRHQGLSLTSSVLAVLYCCAWLLYGVANHSGVQVATNVLGLIGLLAILTGHLVLARPAVRQWLPLLLLGLAVLAVMFALGTRPLGITASVATISGVLPQVVSLARSRRSGRYDASGVSRTRWRLSAAANLLWVAYGLTVGDPVIVVNSGVITAFAVAIVLLAAEPSAPAAAALPLEPEYAVAA